MEFELCSVKYRVLFPKWDDSEILNSSCFIVHYTRYAKVIESIIDYTIGGCTT